MQELRSSQKSQTSRIGSVVLPKWLFIKAESSEQVTSQVVSLNGLVHFAFKQTGSMQFSCPVEK
jgi:hypothetical protein